MTTRTNAPPRRSLVRNFLHLGLGQATTTILTILLSAVMARILSPSDFGLMFLLTSIATFTFVVIDWGHGPLVVREVARNPERAGDLFGSAVAVRSVAALIACPLVIGVTWLLGYDWFTRVLAGLVVLGSLPQYIALSFGWVFRAHERMDREAQVGVAFKLSVFALSVTWVMLGGRMPGVMFVATVAGFLTLAFSITMYRKLQLPRLSASMSTVRTLLRDGAPIFAMTLAIAVEPVINANILYKMSSPEVVGWYSAAWTVAGTLIAPATVLATAIYPRLSAAAGNPAEFRHNFDISLRPLFLLAVLGAVGTFLFANVPVALIFGLPKFAPSADTLRAFAPVLLLMYVDVFLNMAVLAIGKAARLAAVKIFSVVIATGLAFILVPFFHAKTGNGGVGVMYAMATGELFAFVASWMLIKDSISGRQIAADMVRGLVAGVATLLLFRLLPEMTPFLAIPLCVAVFGGLSWLVGAIRQADVNGILSMLRKSPAP
jgi:O-antigen/teichoic acid export membrane protein